jgi:methylmalonyl-CoA mutase cobalamin-binding subunit
MTVASGVRVIYLGPNVPADDIIAFVNVRNDIWAVGLGVSKAYPKKKGATFINRLSKNFPSQIQILLGGEGGKRLETKTARWIKSWPEFMENLKKYDNTLLPTSSQSR